ncbi:MAG: copper resistance protein CopC [Propionibacteriaceae bacterium]|nr:copper resistance protein CopC [Propionibacteriaceae bacterium]
MGAIRGVIVALVSILVAFVGAPRAYCDSLIVASDPQPRAELSARPGWVTLVFKRDVDVSLAKILVLGSEGENVAVGPLIVEGTNVTTQLSTDLHKDTFTVMYRIDRTDGQPEGGAFQFAYGSGTWTSVPASRWSGQSDEPDLMRNPNPKATSAPPTPEAVPTPTEAASTGPAPGSEVPTPGSSSTPVDFGGGGPDPLPWILGVGLISVAAVAGVWLVMKRRVT